MLLLLPQLIGLSEGCSGRLGGVLLPVVDLFTGIRSSPSRWVSAGARSRSKNPVSGALTTSMMFLSREVVLVEAGGRLRGRAVVWLVEWVDVEADAVGVGGVVWLASVVDEEPPL